jgi:parvulin-like peptidyl-prolyl isomerase
MPSRDPHQINERLARQVAKLLEQLEEGEHITLRERFQSLMAIARIQYVFVTLRKEKFDEPSAGTAVRKYQTAFAKNDARGRKKIARPATAVAIRPEPDWVTDDGDDGDAA